jgi:hypothetical protein
MAEAEAASAVELTAAQIARLQHQAAQLMEAGESVTRWVGMNGNRSREKAWETR